MLHRADSLYHSDRSDDLLKLKPWQDAEATVIEILPGKGKFSGMMGALVVKDKSGHIFRIGSGFSDNERRNPPQSFFSHYLQIHEYLKKRVATFCQFFEDVSAELIYQIPPQMIA